MASRGGHGVDGDNAPVHTVLRSIIRRGIVAFKNYENPLPPCSMKLRYPEDSVIAITESRAIVGPARPQPVR
jgi:hypothetical protein